MRHSTRWITRIVQALVPALGVIFVLAPTSAPATPNAVDLGIHLGAGSTQQRAFGTPTGEHVTTTVSGITFWLTVVVGFESSREPAHATFRLELPDGLRWSGERPDAGEGCTSTPSSTQCDTALDDSTTGQFDSWAWRVAARKAGSYVLKAAITEISAADARPSDNATSLTVVVTEGVTLGPAKLSPRRPKAGALVAATVRVTSGGKPVRPSRVGCTGSIAGTKIRGVAKVATGLATCSYRPPKAGKGKVLRGSISVAAAGARFIKSFSTKLG